MLGILKFLAEFLRNSKIPSDFSLATLKFPLTMYSYQLHSENRQHRLVIAHKPSQFDLP